MSEVDCSLEFGTYSEEAIEDGALLWNAHNRHQASGEYREDTVVALLVTKFEEARQRHDIDAEDASAYMAASWLHEAGAIDRAREIEDQFGEVFDGE